MGRFEERAVWKRDNGRDRHLESTDDLQREASANALPAPESDGTDRLNENYTYTNDGRMQNTTDLDDGPGNNSWMSLRFMSRGYGFDWAGRTTGGSPTSGAPTPYSQGYSYDAFDNLTSRAGWYNWQTSQSDTGTFTNNRRNGWTYDPDGRLTLSPANSSSDERDWTYDAAGELISTVDKSSGGNTTYTSHFDCNEQVVTET